MNDTTPLLQRVREVLEIYHGTLCKPGYEPCRFCDSVRDLDAWRERMRPHAYVLEQFFDTYHGVHTPLWELLRLVRELVGTKP